MRSARVARAVSQSCCPNQTVAPTANRNPVAPVQPALFLPHSQIRSVELMRAGGASATFDVVLHLRSGKAHEFSFVARQEAASLEGARRRRPGWAAARRGRVRRVLARASFTCRSIIHD